MNALDPRKVRWIVLHTADYDGDCSAEMIRRWHVEERGWADIGYHYVIRYDGSVERGRDIRYQGAHVFGINGESVGVCFSGNGDRKVWTEGQAGKGLTFVRALMAKYGLPPEAVIGHREVNRLINQRLVPLSINGRSVRTAKTCPGKMINMDAVRLALMDYEPKITEG